MGDADILAALRSLRDITLITIDADFYRRHYCHPKCCLAVMAVPPSELGRYAVRFLRHPLFRTNAARMGKVVRVQPTGLVYWGRNAERERHAAWA
jgi:hypothetical protein